MTDSQATPSPPKSPSGVFLRVLRAKAAEDDVRLRAAALAYSTLASLVPLLAIVLAILSGPAFEESRDKVLDQLTANLLGGDAVGGSWLIDYDSPQERFKQSFRDTIKPLAAKMGAVSVFGFVVLVITVVLLFQAAERSFNAIWRVQRARPFFHRVAIATSLMFWGPIILAVSVSLSKLLSGLLVVGTYFIPTLVTSLLFTAFFMVMPHARVRLKCALAGGAATALCWELAKLLFLLYVTRVVSYDRVYGSLGLIPMLFLWVYVNWLLILYGAELAYCLQHREALLDEWSAQARRRAAGAKDAAGVPASPVIVLAAAVEAARRFQVAAGGVRVGELAEALHVERDLAQRAAEGLVACGVLARVAAGAEGAAADGPAYLPASEPRHCVVSALLAAAAPQPDAVGSGPAVERARGLLAAVAEAGNARLEKVTLADLADEQRQL